MPQPRQPDDRPPDAKPSRFADAPGVMLVDRAEEAPEKLPPGVHWVALRRDPRTPILWDDGKIAS